MESRKNFALVKLSGTLNFIASPCSDKIGEYGIGVKDIKMAVKRVLKRK